MHRIPLALTEHRCPVRRAAKQIKQAVPQMLGTLPLEPPQGLAHQQGNSTLPHRKEVMPQ